MHHSVSEDLEASWRRRERDLGNGATVLLKILLPAGSEEATNSWLSGKGIDQKFVFPDGV